MAYDPEKHHRRSIRLKGHDYAGGGVYFVTLCAHREFVASAKGSPFGQSGAATCVREIIAEEWRRSGEVRDDVFPGEFVVMPDHFHGLISIQKGASELGHVIGAFKAAVSRRIRRGDTHVAHDVRIWHRNYYEMIVRTPEAEKKIAEYIRMNPWRCVQQFGNGLRGMGNPALWNADKLGVLCSRSAPKPKSIPNASVYLSGFHSPMEKEIFAKLLELKKPVVWCPAWGLEKAAISSGAREALEENRLLVLEMRNLDGDLAAAEQRNRFVLEQAKQHWLPHVTPGGMLDRLVRELNVGEKIDSQ
jgi:putative transposase